MQNATTGGAALATWEDLPRLREIWLRSFGANVAYADLFFHHRFSPTETLVWRESGQVQAMLFWLPATLFASGEQGPLAYVYGVATHPQARGQGRGSRLLQALDQVLQARGYWASLLVPAEPSLFSFYQRVGYAQGFPQRSAAFVPTGEATHITLEPITAQELFQLREGQFQGNCPFVQWDVAALQYQMREVQLLHGGVCKLCGPQGTGHAVFYVEREQLLIRELGASGDFAQACLHALCRQFQRERAQVRLAPAGDYPFPTELAPFSMVRYLRDPRPSLAQGYFSLALD